MSRNHIETPAISVLPDGRMTTKEAARYIGLSPKTLAIRRSQGTGPRFVKRGRIFYFQKDVDDWLQAERCVSTAQARSPISD